MTPVLIKVARIVKASNISIEAAFTYSLTKRFKDTLGKRLR